MVILCCTIPPCTFFLVVLLIYFFKFIFNWRIIALQYCVDYCHISAWIGHKYIYVRSLLNLPPPLQVVTERGLSSLHHIANSPSISSLPMAMHGFMLWCYSLNPSHLLHSFNDSSLYLSIPNPTSPLPTGNHLSVLCICESVSVLLCYILITFSFK